MVRFGHMRQGLPTPEFGIEIDRSEAGEQEGFVKFGRQKRSDGRTGHISRWAARPAPALTWVKLPFAAASAFAYD